MSEQLIRIPQYQHLYESLRQDIVKGVFKAGELLPSEKVLQTQHGLTQPTIRQALSLLVQEGYIRKHQGKGSVVQSLPIGLGVASITAHLMPSDDKSLTAFTPAAELIMTSILVKPHLRFFPEEFTFLPQEGMLSEEFYYFERLRSVNGVPIFYEKLVLPNRYLPKFTRQHLDNRSFFDLLRTKYGLVVRGGEQKIQALAADSTVAQQLCIEAGNPVLRLEKQLDTNKNDFSFFSLLFALTDRYLLQGRF